MAGEWRAGTAGPSRGGGGAGTAAVAPELAETTSLIAFLNVQVRRETGGVWECLQETGGLQASEETGECLIVACGMGVD